MLSMPTNLKERYSPLYFLASVGSGGLAVTFFMYLLFWVPHKGRPVPVFEDIMAYLGTADLMGQGMVVFAMAAIAFFVFMNLRLLAWNLREFAIFKQTDAFKNHQKTNAQTQIKAQALALAMSVNAMFIAGLVFVPQLWSVVEYLFPLAMIAFIAIGVLAFKNIAQFLGRVLVEGGFDRAQNNNFSQLLPAFAFSMIGVGLAAPAAMSTTALTAGISLIASTFFLVTAVILSVVALILGINAMMKHGVGKEAAPTLMIVIPILTTLSILVLRQNHGMHVHFEGHVTDIETLMFLGKILSIQLVFGLLGVMVLRRQNYMATYISGAEKSPGSYALACPGIGFSVLVFFFINKGLVATNLVDKYSIAYWALTSIAIASQFSMVWLVLKLNRKHFGTKARNAVAVPAE